MAETEKTKDGRPESPTTARELDFDDDEPASHPQTPAKDTQSAATTPAAATQAPSAATPAPPAGHPPRTSSTAPAAMSEREQVELTLREAFPSIEPGVIKAVLVASGGKVEPAFNALLSMSDPSAQPEAAPAPPAQPPRPAAPAATGGAKNQLEADELYARQLAEHYEQQDLRRAQRESAGAGRHYQQQRGGYEEERERNFIDDELPEIGENIRKGFLETQSKFNGWLNTLKKKIDGEDDDEQPPSLPARRGPDPRAGSSSRRSNDYDRYDADPEEFDSDFSKLQLRDETAYPPPQPARPGANPNLFKPTPALPTEGRRVSFQDGPPEEIRGTPDPNKRPSSTSNKSKWQPLAAADPTPVSDHDPFTVGDSDDEDPKKKDIKPDDSDRLKKAMAEATGDDISSEKKLEPQETTGPQGTKDKVAEDVLTGKS